MLKKKKKKKKKKNGLQYDIQLFHAYLYIFLL